MESDEMEMQRTTGGNATVAGATWWKHGGGVGCRERETRNAERGEDEP